MWRQKIGSAILTLGERVLGEETDRRMTPPWVREWFEHTTDAIFLVDSEDGTFKYANPALEQLAGLSLEHVRGKPAREFLEGESAERHLESLRKRQHGDNKPTTQDYQIQLENGRHAWIEVVAYGTSMGVVAVAREVTKFKEEAKRSAFLKKAIERAPYGIVIASAPDVRIELINETALKMRQPKHPEHLVGISVEQHTLPEHWNVTTQDGSLYDPNDLPLTRAVREGEIVKGGRAWIGRDDGSRIPINIDAYPIYEKEELVGGIVYFRDLREIQEEEEAQRRAEHNATIATLTAGIAHNFNNLLGVILGTAELGLETEGLGDALREDLENICATAKRGGEITASLLRYAKGKENPPKTFDPSSLVNESASLLRRRTFSARKNIEVILQTTQGPTYIHGGDAQIQDAIINLGINAIHAMDETGGTLAIRTRNTTLEQPYKTLTPGDYFVIEVADTGEGIRPEDQGQIFQPYFTRRSEHEGTGLGLHTVLNTITEHHGLIEVESERGQGALFRMYFPHTDIQPGAATSDRNIQYGSECILLAEDEELLRNAIGRQLRALGYTILEAINGTEAVETFREHQDEISLVLSDHIMPGMRGVEAIRQMRIAGYRGPAILSSGLNESMNEELLQEAEIGWRIAKPYGFFELTNIIREAIDSS